MLKIRETGNDFKCCHLFIISMFTQERDWEGKINKCEI